jgi:hypothetical protein
MMQKISLLVMFLIILLSACTAPSTLPTPVPSPSFTLSPEPTASSTPSPTSAPQDAQFSDFPLAVGAAWQYDVQVSYRPAGSDADLETWSGAATLKVVGRQEEAGGKVTFSVEQSVEPAPPEGIWLQAEQWDYIVTGDSIYRGTSQKIFQSPLSDQLTWNAFEGGEYQWKVSAAGQVSTPAGDYDHCHELRLDTLPDTTIVTLCPEVGMVKKFYSHHGDPQIEEWTLTSYQTEPGGSQ